MEKKSFIYQKFPLLIQRPSLLVEVWRDSETRVCPAGSFVHAEKPLLCFRQGFSCQEATFNSQTSPAATFTELFNVGAFTRNNFLVHQVTLLDSSLCWCGHIFDGKSRWNAPAAPQQAFICRCEPSEISDVNFLSRHAVLLLEVAQTSALCLSSNRPYS